MGKLEALGSLFRLYFTEKSEWFYNYKLALYSLLVGGVVMVLYIMMGEFTLLRFLWEILLVILLGHIILSVYVVLGDYLFNKGVKVWCQGLWVILSLRLAIELLVW